jgi:hypothetical protein
MLQARVGVPSAIQDSTFHQNRENANVIDLRKEVLRLRRQRTADLEIIRERNLQINQQKDEIIGLLTKLNDSDYSPLRRAV